MKYLLDADWTISFLNGRREAVELFERLADDGLALSIIVWGEIYEGLLDEPDFDARLAQLIQFTERIDLIGLDTEVASRYGRIRAALRARGQLIPDNDLWIAATALAHDLVLLTRNLRHFRRIPDLKFVEAAQRGGGST